MSYTKKGEDMLYGIRPSEDIACKDCAYRNDGTIWSRMHTCASCQKFPYPQVKPLDVVFKGAECKEYEQE